MESNQKQITFVRHLSNAAKACLERNRAKELVHFHLDKMRRSIITMSMRYSDIDNLKKEIEDLARWEREYSKFFKVKDPEIDELKGHIIQLEGDLVSERQEKRKLMEESNQKIKELSESLHNVKGHTRTLLIEKARKSQRLLALEKRIREKVDIRGYYKSHKH